MTTIPSNPASCTTQSGQVSAPAANSANGNAQASRVGSSFSYDTTDDVVISSQGQESQTQKLELYKPNPLVGTKVKGMQKQIISVEDLMADWDQHSTYNDHVSLTAKMMGIADGLAQSLGGTQHAGTISPNLVYQRSEEVAENLDKMIDEKLKSIGVSLGKDEVLNFSINQDGTVKVDGKHIKSEQTRAAIEKAFNEDSELALELKFSHALRSYYTVDGKNYNANATSLLMECFLEKEYGVSVKDLQVQDSDSGYNKVFATQDGSTALSDRLYEEERFLHGAIVSLISNRQDQSYEVGFSYANGVLLEEGKTDLESLRKTGELYMNQTFIGASRDYSITLDENGRMTNSSVTRHSTAVWGEQNDARTLANDQRILKTRFDEASQSSHDGYLAKENPNAMGIVFQHYGLMELFASDSKRAMQFLFGVDSSQVKDFSVTLSGRSVDWYA